MEDREIVELYLSRDESAISNTAQKYGQRLMRIADRILNDASAAEECVNDTYLQAWQLIPPNEPRTYLFAFLGRITRHLAIDACRRSGSRKRSAVFCELTREMEECIPAGERVDETVDAEELKRSISDFLAGCPEEQRCVFVRRYWHFDTIPEICRRYGFSRSKVKTMLFRMRERLKVRLEEEGYRI